MDMDAAAIVSETDAALSGHSSDEEDHEWLSKSAVASQRRSTAASGRRVLQRVDERGVEQSEQDDNGDSSVDDDNDDQLHEDNSYDENEMSENVAADDLYCANMDDEDEAWVYKHMRSGKEELVSVRTQQQDGAFRDSLSGQTHGSPTNGTMDQDSSAGTIEQMHQALML